MKRKGLIVTLSVVCVVIIAAFAAIIIVTRPNTNDGDKDISVTIVYQDKTKKEYNISTNAEFLGDALLQENLVKPEEHKTGYYLYIDSARADYNLDKAWWCVTENGEMAQVGINQLVVDDGDKFEITHTPS